MELQNRVWILFAVGIFVRAHNIQIGLSGDSNIEIRRLKNQIHLHIQGYNFYEGPRPEKIVFNTETLMQAWGSFYLLIWWEIDGIESPIVKRKYDEIEEIFFTASNLLIFSLNNFSVRLPSLGERVKRRTGGGREKNEKVIFLVIFWV